MDPAYLRIRRAMLVTAPVGLLTHVLLIPLFAALKVWSLLLLNVAFSSGPGGRAMFTPTNGACTVYFLS